MPSTPGAPWFGPEQQRALEDFWSTYELHYDEMVEASTREVEAHPVFGPMLRAMSAEQRAAQNRESHELLRRAIAGDWASYESNLTVQGAVYARLGISFDAWYDLVGQFARFLTPRLVARFAQTPERLSAALLVMQVFLDRAMAGIGASYLETKETALRESERRRASEAADHVDLRARSAELQSENRQIHEANRLKSEFLANMSHELRTPLNAILGFTELIYDGEVGPETPQYREFLGDILASGRHLLQLINDVLDLAKVEAGKVEFHPEEVELARVINEVVAILRTSAASKGIRLETHVEPSIGTVTLDPSRLKQVLYNYVSNALKFSPGGRVSIRARAEGADSIRVEVEDTGIGIAPEDLSRLFVEFQQLDAGAAKKHAGTGLGLALTRKLVEAQGGAVGVRSTLGVGSVFHAVLPRKHHAGRPAPQPQTFPSTHPGAASILVIEDNEADQATLVRTLTDAGYAVETVSTGAHALARCRARVYDAITLDLLLPDTTGPELLRVIRAETINRDVPVIVATVVAERGAVAGFAVADFLSKPLDSGRLLSSLERAGVTPEHKGPVLVVDDYQGSLRLMAATLAQLGFESVCVESGEKGLELAAQAAPLAVVLDLMMPELDGFQFLDRFRRLAHCRRTPVIVWTAKDLTSDEHARLAAAAQGVVLKGREGSASLLDELRNFLPSNASRASGA